MNPYPLQLEISGIDGAVECDRSNHSLEIQGKPVNHYAHAAVMTDGTDDPKADSYNGRSGRRSGLLG
jgi:hypothetical protein